MGVEYDTDGPDDDVVEELAREVRAVKKQKQWRKWSEDVIPALLQPYMTLLRETEGLRNINSKRQADGCDGCSEGRLLNVTCVYFDNLEKMTLCTCNEPALQLLQKGFFPCAPQLPTLAVDLGVLDFARDLFINAAPNTTAWCETLEGFLSARSFKLSTRDSLRGRFGNALKWYATLTNTKNLMLRDYLNVVRGAELSMEDEGDQYESEGRFGLACSLKYIVAHVSISDIVYQPEQVPEMNEQDSSPRQFNDRPDEYLRERCPLCFGGENWSKPSEKVDVIVCLDACFTQKRRQPQGNAWHEPHTHPETVFIPPSEVKAMEEIVESL
ncbi:hypothetical protein M413DRAFT_75239, partial [Hebeloma cylindrosporum]